MGRTKLFIGKVIEPSPAFTLVLTDVHPSERRHNLSVELRRVDVNAVSPKIGTCLICRPMQQKARVGHSPDSARPCRVIPPPARRQMQPSHNAHSMYRRVRTNSFNAAPLHGVEVQQVNLIAGSHIEVAWIKLLCIIKLHREKIHLSWD